MCNSNKQLLKQAVNQQIVDALINEAQVFSIAFNAEQEHLAQCTKWFKKTYNTIPKGKGGLL